MHQQVVIRRAKTGFTTQNRLLSLSAPNKIATNMVNTVKCEVVENSRQVDKKRKFGKDG